jgi:hypothetical protein
MNTLSKKIIEQLQSKHDAFLGTGGELSRQRFKDGLMWAINTVETLDMVDKCEKEYQDQQLTIPVVVKSFYCEDGHHEVMKDNGYCGICNKKIGCVV